jgi:putative transposase
MTPPAEPARSKHHRFPGAVIRHGVWLSDRFPRSDRDVQELLCERGIDGTHEALRPWCLQCGHDDAHQLQRRRPRTGDQWHVAEVGLPLNGQRHALWRAVDHDDHVLDSLVPSRRPTQAAKQCLRKLRKGLTSVPRVIMTDKLKSDGAAQRESVPGVAQRQSRSLTTRCAFSQRPTRHRERRMPELQSAGPAQRFVAVYGPIAQHCWPRRHVLSAAAYRAERKNRCERWAERTGTERTA